MFAFLVQEKVKDKRLRNENERDHPTILPNKLNKLDHRKYAFPAWPKGAVIGMGKICRSWALEHSIRTRD